MVRALFVLGLVIAFEAFGMTYVVQVPGAVDLATGAPIEAGKGDLTIKDGMLRAPRGIRVDGPRSLYRTRIPLLKAAPLRCRAAHGREFLVMVVSEQPGQVVLDVSTAQRTVGTFAVASMAVNGVATPMPMQPLRLLADGTYELGSSWGWTDVRDHTVALDGPFRAWGAAQVAENGELLIFRFRREGRRVQLVLQRVYDDYASKDPGPRALL